MRNLAELGGARRISGSYYIPSNDVVDNLVEYFLGTSRHMESSERKDEIHHDDVVALWEEFNGGGSYDRLLDKNIEREKYRGGIMKPYSRRGSRVREIVEDQKVRTKRRPTHNKYLRSTQYLLEDLVIAKLSTLGLKISESALITFQYLIETTMIDFFELVVVISGQEKRKTVTEKDILSSWVVLRKILYPE